MAKRIVYLAPVEYMSGKFAKNSDTVSYNSPGNAYFYSSNRDYGITTGINNKVTKFWGFRNKYVDSWNATQEAKRLKLKNAVQAADLVLSDPDSRSQAILAWKAQKKYSTLRGYVIATEYAKL